QVQSGDLLGGERRLALGEQQHAGDEAKPLRDGGQVTEEHQDLVEDMLRGVRRTRKAPERSRTKPLARGTEQVVVSHEMVGALRLARLREAPDGQRVRAAVRL